MPDFNNTQIAFESKSDSELKKTYYLFKLIGNPYLTKAGAWFFNIPFAADIPLIRPMVRNTIYNQFVGGETPEECVKVASELYEYGVSSILDYSVEGQTEESDFDHVKDVILALIDVTRQNESIPFVVFKPTALGKIELYEKVGKNRKLTPEEEIKWQHIRERFDAICKKGYELSVRIMIDAEESWMQDAADDLADEMMMKYNLEKPIVCNTLQMYRHDRLEYLKKMYEKAEREGYWLSYKIVRGAYMEKERERAEKENYTSPIQPDKQHSDDDYNKAVEFIISKHHRIALFAGTHNEQSCSLLIDLMNKAGIQNNDGNVWFGQLYGMSDNISFNLAKDGYNIAKYLPYGPIKEVMPYLIRRAQENTSVAGQTGRELSLIEKEIKRRKSL